LALFVARLTSAWYSAITCGGGLDEDDWLVVEDVPPFDPIGYSAATS
jgi:hypothetical protein